MHHLEHAHKEYKLTIMLCCLAYHAIIPVTKSGVHVRGPLKHHERLYPSTACIHANLERVDTVVIEFIIFIILIEINEGVEEYPIASHPDQGICIYLPGK